MIDGHGVPEVSLKQFAILAFKDLERECAPGLLDGMNHFLELCEHRLPVKRSANVVDLPVDNVSAHFRVAGFFQQKMGEQFLVKGAGNFRQENWVIVVL